VATRGKVTLLPLRPYGPVHPVAQAVHLPIRRIDRQHQEDAPSDHGGRDHDEEQHLDISQVALVRVFGRRYVDAALVHPELLEPLLASLDPLVVFHGATDTTGGGASLEGSLKRRTA